VGEDFAAAERIGTIFLASRETAELRAETVQMGFSLARLLNGLDGMNTHALARLTDSEKFLFPPPLLLPSPRGSWRRPTPLRPIYGRGRRIK
jgi:urease accessory protein UreF